MLGLQSKNTHIVTQRTVFQTLFQKRNPEFKMSESPNSSRHPDGIGAEVQLHMRCTLDPGLLGSHSKEHISGSEIFQGNTLTYKKLATRGKEANGNST